MQVSGAASYFATPVPRRPLGGRLAEAHSGLSSAAIAMEGPSRSDEEHPLEIFNYRVCRGGRAQRSAWLQQQLSWHHPVDDGTGGGVTDVLDVQPSDAQTINIAVRQTTPTVTFTATLNGQPTTASWSLRSRRCWHPTAGPNGTEIFTPKGTSGGLVTVTVKAGGQTVQRQILVALTTSGNGADTSIPSQQQQIPATRGDLTKGGGVGGVGGEGLGPKVTDQAILNALDNPTSNGSAQGLALLYPYDKMVWPRGLLAPLLMWNWTVGDADAIKIEIKSTGGPSATRAPSAAPRSWPRPAASSSVIPSRRTSGTWPRTAQAVPTTSWSSASRLRRAARGGPISETWSIAPARPAGIIYYNSYGTQLRANSGEASFNGGPEFGAAVLSIKAGDTKPTVVAGTSTPAATRAAVSAMSLPPVATS